MKYLSIILLISTICSQSTDNVTIITTDGSEIIGKIVEESDSEYKVETPAGLSVIVPKDAVYEMSKFKGEVREGKLFQPDPNKSLYLFSPSAYPIGKDNKYCRDFLCIFSII